MDTKRENPAPICPAAMRSVLIIVGMLAAVVVNAPAVAQSNTGRELPPSWLELKKGTPAYTGMEGGGDSVSVCGSQQEWLQHESTYVECAQKTRGLPITIASDEFAKYHVGSVDDYGVFIRADNAAWSGWISSSELTPRIPAHTKLMIVPHCYFPRPPSRETECWPVFLWANQDMAPLNPDHLMQDTEKTETLDKGTIVEVISQDPKTGKLDLYVDRGERVPQTIRKGWLSSIYVSLPDNQSLTFQPPTGYTFKNLNVGSFSHGLPVTSGRLIGSTATITTTIAACSQEDMDRLLKFAKAKDEFGLSAFVTPRIARGECVLLLLGDSVRIDATDEDLDRICVRPKDEAKCFWTLYGAIGRR
jgi:hypothetical protein